MAWSDVLRGYERRRKRILRERASGATLAQLAKKYNLSKVRISQIINQVPKNG